MCNPAKNERRCMQCGECKHEDHFRGKHKQFTLWCADCKVLYRTFAYLKPENRRRRFSAESPLRVSFVLASGNRKTGRIPVSMSSASTCPPSCSFFGQGCYAEQHLLGNHWAKVPRIGMSWADFTNEVRRLPPGQLWRHNEAGDLPGRGEALDVTALTALIFANRGRRGFTYTHKPLARQSERNAVRRANDNGFTINLSADTIADADRLYDLRIGPVTVVVPEHAQRSFRTPKGRKIVICPAVTHENITCQTCRLCAVPARKSIVAFPAHGQMSQRVSQLVQIGKNLLP